MKKVVLLAFVLVLLSTAVVVRFISPVVSYPAETELLMEVDLPVHNIDSGKNFSTIQEAINDDETLNGHTILVDARTFYEHVTINKSISLIGENKHNTIIDGEGTGTVIEVTANNVNFSGFTVQNSEIQQTAGICLSSVNCCNVFDDSFSGNWYGIQLDNSSNNTLRSNMFLNNHFGIYLNSSSHNAIKNNTASSGWLGISFRYSNSNRISENNISENKGDGITLWYCSNNTFSSNVISSNDFGVSCWNCSRNTFSRNILSSNRISIFFNYGFRNVLSENHISSHQEGVIIQFGLDNILSCNIVCSNPLIGIRLTATSTNVIFGNNITSNRYGVYIEGSSNNTFYHNNFINNTVHVRPSISPFTNNTWDNGTEGNYWSDYNGTDADHDGIGDIEYEIIFNNIDHYPLMGMFHSFSTPLDYDVNVISNSTIEDFHYFESNSTIRMYVSNMTATQTFGFCRVCILKGLMSPPYEVIINDGLTAVLYFNDTVFDNGTHRWIYFAYEHSTHKVDIIPEFPTWTSMLLILMVLTVAIVIYKRRLLKTPIH